MIEPIEDRIIANAKLGRYLLPYRHRRSVIPTDVDLEYEACERLVQQGKARWLSERFAPGIQLDPRIQA